MACYDSKNPNCGCCPPPPPMPTCCFQGPPGVTGAVGATGATTTGGEQMRASPTPGKQRCIKLRRASPTPERKAMLC